MDSSSGLLGEKGLQVQYIDIKSHLCDTASSFKCIQDMNDTQVVRCEIHNSKASFKFCVMI